MKKHQNNHNYQQNPLYVINNTFKKLIIFYIKILTIKKFMKKH